MFHTQIFGVRSMDQGHTPAVALASRTPTLALEMAFLAEKAGFFSENKWKKQWEDEF